MKKFLLTAALLAPFFAFSQTKYIFYYEQSSKKITKYDKIVNKKTTAITDFKEDLSDVTFSQGDIVQVKIEDINTYTYNINIQIDNQSFNTQPPKLLAGLTTDFDPTSAISAAISGKALAPGKKSPNPYKYSKILAGFISQVVDKRKSFYYESVALRDRNLNARSDKELLAVKTLTEAQLKSEFESALNLIDAVQNKYLEIVQGGDIEDDDKKLLDILYTGFTAKDYRTVFENYFTELLNVKSDDFAFETSEVIVTGEKVNITIVVKPVVDDKLKDATIAAATTRTYGILTQDLWHWSFSGGFFMSGLRSKTYASKPFTRTNPGLKVPADTVAYYQNVLDNDPSVSIGANVLVHYTYKCTPNFELGGHFGLGVPINSKANLNYMLGLSMMFFHDNRLGINVGGVAGMVQELSPNVDTNVQYRKSGDVPISYVDKLKGSWQFSITYNIGSLFAKSPAAATTTSSAK